MRIRVRRQGFRVIKMKRNYFLTVTLLLCYTLTPVFTGSATEVSPELLTVNEKISSIYSLILEIEEVGGDASAIVGRLNLLLDDVSMLEAVSEKSSEDLAILFKDVSSIEQDLITLRQVASSQAELHGRNLYLYSFLGVISILLVGFISWRWFKCFYIQRMMKMRPEVVTIES